MKRKNLKNTNLILIPARKNSKSIKNKNIKLFCGKPLIYWTIKLALKSNLGRVCVSTDSKKIQNYARSLGAESPFLRPKNIAQDKTSSEPVIKHAINFYKNKNIKFNLFFLLQPTSPFRIKSDLVNAWNLLKKNKKCTSVFSVSLAEGNNNPYWMIKKNKKKAVKFIDNKPLQNLISRRQLLPDIYFRNDFVYLSKISNIFYKKPNIYGTNPMLLISNKERLEIDINTKKEWTVAEKLFEIMRKKNRY
jgi:CMP-N,N'-diacetyllegionaminic acid synthase